MVSLFWEVRRGICTWVRGQNNGRRVGFNFLIFYNKKFNRQSVILGYGVRNNTINILFGKTEIKP